MRELVLRKPLTSPFKISQYLINLVKLNKDLSLTKLRFAVGSQGLNCVAQNN
jgi:hypothetical protein